MSGYEASFSCPPSNGKWDCLVKKAVTSFEKSLFTCSANICGVYGQVPGTDPQDHGDHFSGPVAGCAWSAATRGDASRASRPFLSSPGSTGQPVRRLSRSGHHGQCQPCPFVVLQASRGQCTDDGALRGGLQLQPLHPGRTPTVSGHLQAGLAQRTHLNYRFAPKVVPFMLLLTLETTFFPNKNPRNQ